jgi:hypothetical protein
MRNPVLDGVPFGSEAVYLAGYHARSVEDCPHAYDHTQINDPYTVWHYGYHQHQRDRARVTELQAKRWCHDPLGHAKFAQ